MSAPTATIDLATYHHVQPVLYGYAQRAVRNEDLAHDLVQETWAAAARHIDSFEGRSRFRSWMVGILKRKIIDHWRSRRPVDELGEGNGPVLEPRPELDLDRERAMAVLARELERLPTLQRRAIELADVQDLDRDEVAARLGVERGHLRVLLHRGRHRLRDALVAAGVEP